MYSNSTSGSRLGLRTQINQLPLKCLILTITALPLHNINASKAHQYNAVFNSNTLTVVAVSSPTAAFQDGEFLHGFGYDMVRNYAQSLNVQLKFKIVSDNNTAMRMIEQGKANIALNSLKMSDIESRNMVAFSASCGDFNSLKKNGLDTELNWVFKYADDPLTETASAFVCNAKQNGSLQQLASFYNRNVVKPESWNVIQKDLNKRLPIYKASFKSSAKKYDLDWQLLAAIAYQESYLKPESVSPTGVRGLMMLTDSTARAMGVSNRVDPSQSIQGGAKYYDLMLSRYAAIPQPDRHWFALVAYNMGPGAVSQIQSQIRAQGKNPNQWIHMYEFLNRNQARNGRYRQAVQYVTRIRAYLEHIKTSPRMLDL